MSCKSVEIRNTHQNHKCKHENVNVPIIILSEVESTQNVRLKAILFSVSFTIETRGIEHANYASVKARLNVEHSPSI